MMDVALVNDGPVCSSARQAAIIRRANDASSKVTVEINVDPPGCNSASNTADTKVEDETG